MEARIELKNTSECIEKVRELLFGKIDSNEIFVDTNKESICFNIGNSNFELGSILIKNSDNEIFVHSDEMDRKIFY